MEARQRYLEEMSADHSADYLIALDLDCQEVAKRAVLNAGPTRRRELLLCEAVSHRQLSLRWTQLLRVIRLFWPHGYFDLRRFGLGRLRTDG